MTLRLTAVFALTAALIVGPVTSAAQTAGKSGTRQAERAALIQGLARGQEITINGTRYQHIPELRAVHILKKEHTSRILGQLGAKASDLVDSREGLAFVRRPHAADPAAQTEIVNNHTIYPVVINIESRQLGFLSGTIIVKPRNLADAMDLATAHDLVLLRSYDHLGIALFSVQKGDLLAAAARIAADPKVVSAEAEVVEHIRTPK